MSDVTTPSTAEFSVNERPREYTAYIRAVGIIILHIEADSKEDAGRQALAQIEKMEDEGYAEIDDIRDMKLDYVLKDQPMFRVMRNGWPMQVSRLTPGDMPRAPDERGF